MSQNTLVDLCKTFCNLRILELRSSNIITLPNSIDVLMHLRYLCIRAEIRTLPDSIGCLRNLIILDVSECEKLQHVPSSIINLKQLRALDLIETMVEGIPTGLRNLEKLIELDGFKPSKSGSEGFSSLDELETLTHLIALFLEGLEKVTDKNIAKRAELQCKYKLKVLGLKYTTLSWEDQVSQTNEKNVITEEILNELCPPPSIEILAFEGYYGSCLPNWLNLGTTLSNLTTLIIKECNYFENLPALGQLPNLNTLLIYARSVLKVGEEFLWGDIKSSNITSPAFSKLSDLCFGELLNWKEWKWNKGEPAMPKLKEFLIRDCPQLRSLQEGLLHHATSLEKLLIKGAHKVTTVQNLPFIKDIYFFDNQNLERISNLPKISSVIIKDCPNLKTVENLNALSRMELVDSKMEALPEYLMAIMPQKLRIELNEELLQKITSQKESGSEWHKFNHIPKVTFYLDDFLYATYQKIPFSFTTNMRE